MDQAPRVDEHDARGQQQKQYRFAGRVPSQQAADRGSVQKWRHQANLPHVLHRREGPASER